MGNPPLTKPSPIDSRKRVVIPDEVMRALDLDVGDHVSFELLPKEKSARVLKVRVSWDPV